MMTAGPPSVAIFVAAMLPSGEGCRSPALRWRLPAPALPQSRRPSSPHWRRGGVTSAGVDRHRCGCLLSRTFRVSLLRPASVLPASMRPVSPARPAWPPRPVRPASWVRAPRPPSHFRMACCPRSPADRTRSSANVGIGGSSWRVNTCSAGARRDGRLANSSCAERNSAAAPSPKTRTDIDSTIAANRKRKPGSMDASFPPCREAAGLLTPKGTR